MKSFLVYLSEIDHKALTNNSPNFHYAEAERHRSQAQHDRKNGQHKIAASREEVADAHKRLGDALETVL